MILSMTVFKNILFLFIFTICTSCQSTENIYKKFSSAKTKINFNGSELLLETYLWRDFMPISPPDGKPLIGSLKIISHPKTQLEKIKINEVWLVNGNNIWSTKSVEIRQYGLDYEVIVRDGPYWKPGIRVGVMMELKDQSGLKYLIKAENQLIRKTQ